MRFAARSDQQKISRAVDALTALADTGVRHVEIRRVLGWLGVAWREPDPVTPPTMPDGADPLTGCAPVSARPQP